MAHTHVDFLFYAIPMIMVFALVLVLLLCKVCEGETQPFSFMMHWSHSMADAAIALPVLALMGVFTPLMLGEYYTVQANRMMGTFSGPGAEINTANAIGFGMNDRPYLLAASMTSATLIGGNYPHETKKELFHRADRLLEKALQRNSRLAGAWFQRGYMVKTINPSIVPKDYPDAETCFKNALSINPLHMPSRLALADLYESRGDMKTALDILADGVRWPYPGVSAMDYYDRTEKIARALHRDDLMPVIEKSRETQRTRLEAARTRAHILTEAGLSTEN